MILYIFSFSVLFRYEMGKKHIFRLIKWVSWVIDKVSEEQRNFEKIFINIKKLSGKTLGFVQKQLLCCHLLFFLQTTKLLSTSRHNHSKKVPEKLFLESNLTKKTFFHSSKSFVLRLVLRTHKLFFLFETFVWKTFCVIFFMRFCS